MKKLALKILTTGSKLFVMAWLLVGCTDDPVLWNPRSTELVITQYVEINDQFSEFNELLISTGLNSLLSVRGPFTLFLPDNDAMREYYTLKGVSSFSNLSADLQYDLVMNHLIPARIETGDMGLGAIREVNGAGDYIVTEFDGSDIILNKYSKIIRRNVITANGVVHHIQKVLDPLYKNVFEVLEELPGFSIFTEGLRRTNLIDTLSLIEFPFGQRMVRTRFTVLAVADTTYNRFGISNIDQLIAKYTDDPGSITQINNGFYRYMEYHSLAGTSYLNQLETGLYPVISYDNNVSVTIGMDYMLNLDPVTQKYTGFIIEHSNYPAKNGAIHTVNDPLPVFQPRPSTLIWETTDHFDLKQGDYFGKHYMRWFDGQNTFENIKWEGDYLLYYWKNRNTGYLRNDDCLSMSGWWWVEVTTPKIMRGKYRITSNLWSGQIDYAVYVDGVHTATINRSDPAGSTSWGEFEWNETKEHTIKVVARSPGMLFWDYLTFTPI